MQNNTLNQSSSSHITMPIEFAESQGKALTALSQEVSKLTRIMQQFTENQIRQEEKEKRQDELNSRTSERLKANEIKCTEIQAEIMDIKLKRAEEAQGVKIVSKYWWVLLLLGTGLTYQITKALAILPATV